MCAISRAPTESEKRTGTWAWKHPHQADGSVTYTLLQGDVRLNEVDFGYDEDKMVLHNVSVFAEPGQKVAFVGATGAGKTTIIKLLLRLYDPSAGTIYYNGKDIREYNLKAYRELFATTFQDFQLFGMTVKENVCPKKGQGRELIRQTLNMPRIL